MENNHPQLTIATLQCNVLCRKKMNASTYKKYLDLASLEAPGAIAAIADAASRMPVATKAFWTTRLNHVYGDMGGQRAVSLHHVSETNSGDNSPDHSDTTNVVIALEMYYSLVCILLAAAALRRSPAQYLNEILSSNPEKFKRNLEDLLDGRVFEQFGIYGFRNSLDAEWLPESLSTNNLESLSKSMRFLADAWNEKTLIIPGLDPLQQFHKVILPKNLMHITGQFYSPEWLAQLLIDDIDYTGEGRIIDPFCGSGVFLLVALEKALSQGLSVESALKNVLGIDLNPSACVAARCNIVMWLANREPLLKEPVSLNILNADSITPAVIKGQSKNGSDGAHICVDGSMVSVSREIISRSGSYAEALKGYGLDLSNWSERPLTKMHGSTEIGHRDRRITEQLFLFGLKPAQFLATNPPWVGWEYMSRPYRSEVQPAWDAYDLFTAKGLDAAFLKEDLSTLAMVSAWDLYLKDKGKSCAVLKPSTMKADLTGKGIRRLRLPSNGTPLRLGGVREFERMKVFSDAQTETCAWLVEKGEETKFPVPVNSWKQETRRWAPDSFSQVNEVVENIRKSRFLLQPTDPKDSESRWMIVKNKDITNLSAIRGTNEFKPRMGVFTGGANAVFYFERNDRIDTPKGVSSWTNIVHRAKRAAPQRTVKLEDQIVRKVVRGRDIEMWRAIPEVFMLFPHDSRTGMYPLAEEKLSSNFPQAWKYLTESVDILKSRKGFAGWEKKIHQQYYYTLQRVGEYTFAPFKVCWKYVCSEFTVCVLGSRDAENEFIPNDKVMFIPFDSEIEAYYVGGVLSSKIVRQYVHSCMSSRQISTSIIKNVSIPHFDYEDKDMCEIARLCKAGHELAASGAFSEVEEIRNQLNEKVEGLYAIRGKSRAV